MKNVLLTTTALVAFAGAATAAEVALDWSGSAFVEYDLVNNNFDYGADAVLDVTITQDLNNGAVASLALSGFADWVNGGAVVLDPSWIAKVETSYGSISVGDITDVNNGAFSAVDGMDVFAGTDYSADYAGENITFGVSEDWWGADPHIVRAETSVGGWALAASSDEFGDTISFNATGSAGGVDLGGYYQSDYGTTTMGATASGTVGALSYDVAVASASWGSTSMGVAVGYAVTDAISLSASHAINSDVADQTAVGVAYDDGSISASLDYDVDASTWEAAAGYTGEVASGTTVTVGTTFDSTNTFGASIDIAHVAGDLTVYAGADTDTNIYAGVVYDLGGGASAYGYYSDNGTDSASELGPQEWDQGTVLGLAMTF